MDILEVDILEVFNLSMGKIGRIKFPDDKYPVVGMIIRFDDELYKITGVVVTVNPVKSIINQDFDNNIYHCKIEIAEFNSERTSE